MEFDDVDRSLAFETFVDQKSRTLRRRIKSYKDRYRLKLELSTMARKNDRFVKMFVATGILRLKGIKDLVAKAKSKDPHVAMKTVIDRLETQVRRYTEKVERSRSTVGRTLHPVRQFKYEIAQ